MIKNIVMTALVTLFLGVVAVSAQDKKTDFSGTWNLDVSKSKLDERMRVESMTLTVSQTDKELTESTTTKRLPRPEGDAPQGGGAMMSGGGRQGGGGMGRGAMMGGETNATYSLDGKETTVQQDSPMGQTPVKQKASFEKDGKLKLSSSRTFTTQMGEMSITSKETWELVDGGKGLKVHRETETPRGSQSADFYYAKQ